MTTHKSYSSSIIDVAADYAKKCHAKINQMYGDKPYSYHLDMVAANGRKYAHLLPKYEDAEICIAGCFVHDVIEDALQTYNDVKAACGEDVADIAYALTNEKGKTRKQRANEKLYKGIREDIRYVYVKLCDRMANLEHSKMTNAKMFVMYKNEHDAFIEKIFFPPIVRYLPEFLQKLYLDYRGFDALKPMIEDMEKLQFISTGQFK